MRHPLFPIAIVALLAAVGCQRSMVREALDIDSPKTDAQSAQLDFWHSLPGKSAVSNNEGLHGLILFADGTDPSTNYDERVALAKERGWVSQSFNEPGDLVMQRGTLAKAVTVATGIKGGVMMQITNSHGRYAARELQYLGIMGESTEQQAISGLDFVGVISKVQDYQASEAARAEGRGGRATVIPPREQNTPGEAPTGEPVTPDTPAPDPGEQVTPPAPEPKPA
ncbi:MAG: hypothetical protein ACKVZJ_03325 [Phycisphaerales bacterium]